MERTVNNARANAALRRVWRYGPLLAWMLLIFWGSTDALSASNTSGLTRKILLFISPTMSEGRLAFFHFVIRKGGHFTEYAVLALLAARAFATSSSDRVRRRHIIATFLLVSIYAFLDEYHQSFVPTRGASPYDSLIDISGGASALLALTLLRRRLNARG